jgi:hypothetical protein
MLPFEFGIAGHQFSNSKFEKSGGISGGQRVKWLKHILNTVTSCEFKK